MYPTGKVYTQEELQHIADIALKHVSILSLMKYNYLHL